MAASGIRTIPLIATFVIGVVVGLVVSTIPQVRDSLDAPLGLQGAAQAPGEDTQPGDHTIAADPNFKALFSNAQFRGLFSDARYSSLIGDARIGALLADANFRAMVSDERFSALFSDESFTAAFGESASAGNGNARGPATGRHRS